MDTNINEIAFDMPKNKYNSIKVIGVGGGGGNAVDYMYLQNISGVDFVICNTDAQALENSPIPNKIQLGADLTKGMGAGANPEIGAKAAEESYSTIRELLVTNTKMVFITAGMGGGTGTGAAPIIAKIAKELDLLTVGIVTMPFEFEGRSRMKQAQEGIKALREQVDSLIVINNNKLREVYGNLGYKSGFAKADEVLSTAARGIADVITHHYKQNIDLNDAKTVLSNSGTAIMGSATASGEDRAQKAIVNALDSPLLNDNKITGAKNVLLLIVSGTDEVTFDEIGEINDYIRNEAGNDINIILGIGDDESLGDAITVTIIATGFSSGQQQEITETEVKKIVHSLEEDQELQFNFDEPKQKQAPVSPLENEDVTIENRIIHTLEEENQEPSDLIPTSDFIKNIDVAYDVITQHSDTSDAYKDDETYPIDEQDDSFKQMKFTFDFPIEQDDFQEVELTDEIKNIEVIDEFVIKEEVEELLFDKEMLDDIEVVDPVQIEADFEAVTKTHDLGTFEDTDINKKSEEKHVNREDETDANLQFELKILTDEETVVQSNVSETGGNEKEEFISPLNASIADFKKTAAMRKKKLKKSNYVFPHNASNIDEIEKEPAYKRQNIDLDESTPSYEINKSRTTIDVDKNDEIQLRSNNSFLHDNVD